MDTCYMCEKPATGFEHVPPKSLFPRGSEYRKHLITVPSCDAHNSSKSKDDEYLRHVVVSAPGANEFALKVADEALIRSFERRPHIMKTFLDKVRLVAIGTAETAAFQIDIRRFEGEIDAIARGLYFYETGKKLFSETQFIWGALFTPDLSKTPFFDFIRNTEQRTPARYKGSNPEIFRYALDLFHDGREGLCRVQFYKGHPIYIVWGGQGETE